MTCDKRWTEFARGFVKQSEVGNLRGPDDTLINETDKVSLRGMVFSGTPDECSVVRDALVAALGEMFEKFNPSIKLEAADARTT